MILNLRGFEEFPADIRIEAEPGQFKSLSGRVIRVEKVVVELAVQKSGEEYFCQGSVSAQLLMECARCLAEFPMEVDSKTDFVISAGMLAEKHKDVIDDEDYVLLRGNDLCVDVSEPVRQAVVLSLPLKPLCSEECKGLCARCGTNLNKKTCSCVIEETDSRWDGLRDIFPGK
ncbi:MAG: hypothetical protein DRP45_04695 [Candidatus Zixiibacteriota bacterium]|nr:MAG: hypothetical protein DRP45_04695 [candidate division Zixibacteria bacterium]